VNESRKIEPKLGIVGCGVVVLFSYAAIAWCANSRRLMLGEGMHWNWGIS
jgi:hypothetical protein